MKNKIYTLIPLLVMLSISLAACSTYANLNTKPEKIRQAASQIASIDIPSGYNPEFSASAMGYTAVSYRGKFTTSHLYLIQSEKQADQERLEQMLAEIVIGTGDRVTGLVVVDKLKAEIRQEGTEVVISEGTNAEGVTYRQAAVAFQGNGGPAMLVYLESAQNWNQAALDMVLTSLH